MKVAKERKSSVLASNAIHHRIDSLTSIVALVTIGGAHVFSNASWLDPVGGVIISLMVIQAGYGNSKASLLELADTTIDEEIKSLVHRAATKALARNMARENLEIRNIQGIKSGQNYLMEVEVAVPGSWSIERTQIVEEILRTGIGSRVRGVRRIRVRFVSNDAGQSDFIDEFIPANVSPRGSPEPEDVECEHNHDHEMNGKTESAIPNSNTTKKRRQ
jgi:divalent metal cation (Fe/Co/Zn/Cd) transporter